MGILTYLFGLLQGFLGMIEVLVLYYSHGGSVKALANLVARGVGSVSGVKARVRTVPPVSIVYDENHSTVPDNDYPYVSLEDLSECSGLAIGAPVRFGNMPASLKYFWDSTSSEWLLGGLEGKPACVFTSSSSMHGGQEACLLSMMLPLIHHGMVIVGLPYVESKLMYTSTGGTPYGVSHVSGEDNDKVLSEDERSLALLQGKRLAEVALKLSK